MLKTTAQKETNNAPANLRPNRGQSFFAAASGPVIQPKLTINNPNDEYEREADAVADKVMRMENPGIQLKPLPVTSVQRKCTHCKEEEKKPVQRKKMNNVDLSLFNPDKNNKVTADLLPSQHPLVIQRKCAACEAEQKKELQRKEMNGQEATADSSLENYIGNLNNGGQSLSNEVRSFYEPRFGYDFSQVKVHTGNVAAKSANSINALAYTSGNHIVFNNRQYAPDTDSGKRLL